jgi:LPS O-antigen subunit length determinant protein (WzzB/FepE family)
MQGTSDPLNQVEISSEEKEFSFKDLLEAIWINKFLIIIFPLLVGSITALYTLTLPNMYRAEVLLASSESKNQNTSAASTGLAALAGVSLQSTDNKTLIAIETLKSRKFISEFLIRHEALPALMAPISWNSEEDILEVGEYHGSIQQATKRFMAIFSAVKLSRNTPFVLLNIEHISPTQGRDWLEAMVKDLNQFLSERDLAEVENSIKYLQEQINKTNVSDLQQLFYSMIEAQTGKAMLAEVRPEYVFRVIDPAIAPELKYSPYRALITLQSVVYSLVAIIVLCVLLYLNNQKILFTRSPLRVSLSKINGT